jgi:hypothetical protein
MPIAYARVNGVKEGKSAMPNSKPRRKPFLPSLTVIVGLLVGLAGLVMTVLGIGGVSITHLSISNTVDVQTTSGGVLAMIVGFGMAIALQIMAMRVDLAIAKVLASRQNSAEIQGSRQGTFDWLGNGSYVGRVLERAAPPADPQPQQPPLSE